MHQNLGYLFSAFAITWTALFAYLFIVQRTVAQTGERLRALEEQRPVGEREEPGGRA